MIRCADDQRKKERKKNQRLQTHINQFRDGGKRTRHKKMSSKFRPIVKWHEKCIVGKGNAPNTYAAHGRWAGIGEEKLYRKH